MSGPFPFAIVIGASNDSVLLIFERDKNSFGNRREGASSIVGLARQLAEAARAERRAHSYSGTHGQPPGRGYRWEGYRGWQ